MSIKEYDDFYLELFKIMIDKKIEEKSDFGSLYKLFEDNVECSGYLSV